MNDYASIAYLLFACFCVICIKINFESNFSSASAANESEAKYHL